MKTIREKILEQIDLQEEVQSVAGINLVTCGNCGGTLFHKITSIHDDIDIVCPYCDYTSEPCDFPDYFYTGMENSEEFEEPKFICGSCGDHVGHYTYNEETDTDECDRCKSSSANLKVAKISPIKQEFVDYAVAHIKVTEKENNISVHLVDGKVNIETVCGKCYELSDYEVKYQAEEYLRGKLEQLKQE